MAKDVPYIIGFSDSLHDRSVCLLKGAELIFAIEEERLTRLKHGLPIYEKSRDNPALFSEMKLEDSPVSQTEPELKRCIDYCLNAAGIQEKDVSVYIGNSLHNFFPLREKAVFLNHHLAHAASAFYTSGFENAAILVADGYGDAVSPGVFETVAIAHGSGKKIEIDHMVTGKVSQYYDMENSIGVFYRIGTILSGFGMLDEGKMMGLSAYGVPCYVNQINEFIKFNDDGVAIDNENLWLTLSPELKRLKTFEDRSNVAASFQLVLQEIMLYYAKVAYRKNPSKNLCLAGGVALNCVANNYIREKGDFENVYVLPAPGDNGISLGGAYYAAHAILGLERTERIKNPYMGQSYTEKDILSALESHVNELAYTHVPDDEALAKKIVDVIANDEVVMVYNGGAEFGPRALGKRSIIASPRKIETRDYINKHVKFREMFRPLAPMVVEEEVSEYFDIDCPSPFMLFSPKAREITKKVAPAIVHIDGSARLQTINRETYPMMHRVLSLLKEKSGIPIVLNTSFNGKDEPIVENPANALNTFLKSPLNTIFLGNYMVTRRDKVEREAA